MIWKRNGPAKRRRNKTIMGRLFNPPQPLPDDGTQPFVSHLIELRSRLIRAVAAVLLVFLVMSPFANMLYAALAEPLMSKLPQGSTMIATGVAAPFLTPFKFTLVFAIFITMPFALYQAWAFIAPGLYTNERRYALPILASSTILFYLGMAFAYWVVFPLAFSFLIGSSPEGVTVAPDISQYLDFVMKLFFAFGIAFEVPVATVLIIMAGVSTAESLVKKRPYIIVGAFIFGMLLTPPDIISQFLLALPMWGLFELGIYVSRFFPTMNDTAEEVSHEDSKN